MMHKVGVLMVPLPPYWCELNPSELVFQILLARLRSDRARYNLKNNNEFHISIINEIMQFLYDYVIAGGFKCRYKYSD